MRMARLNAALLLAQGYDEVRTDPLAARIYPLDENWPSLEKMEDEAILQIITGAKPLDYFDEFVQQWYAAVVQPCLRRSTRTIILHDNNTCGGLPAARLLIICLEPAHLRQSCSKKRTRSGIP